MEQKINKSNIIGSNINKHRVKNSLTQEELSSRMQVLGIDISRGTLAKLESGIRNISVPELESIRSILQMSYEDFFRTK